MIEARRAAVRPRGLLLQGSTPLLLDEEIRSFLEAGARGNLALLGCGGLGKTTALAHLTASLPSLDGVVLLDEPKPCQLADAPDSLVIYTSATTISGIAHLAVYNLAAWSRDEVIEYLLAVHRPRCASVMARVRADDSRLLGGVPELWRIALDRLAADETLPDVRSALHCHLCEHLCDTDLVERARSACLNVVVTGESSLADVVTAIARPGFTDGLIRLLRHRSMQLLLAGERLAADLHEGASCDYLVERLPRDFVEATGARIAEDARAREHLHALLAGPTWSHAMAVSLLHAAGASAALRDKCPKQLAGAYLDGISWPGGDLQEANLQETDLTQADLQRANLNSAFANKAKLRQVRFTGATLNGFIAKQANLSAATLSHCQARSANFLSANLQRTDFSKSRLWGCNFTASDLTAALFRGANLSGADLTSAIVSEADFSEADLTEAVLSNLRLSEAYWEGARFTEARLEGCDLEYMTLPAANFEGADLPRALLTGSTMFGGNFRGACLREAGLAEIEWENADLRYADLRGASFHMGSTRGGLVGSTIPCEGSKTGFYTDDYDEQTYKAPEEIRKANLCGADLRGAILDGVDFYLVDLRGALYDDKYADHLRRCGAILEARV